MVDHHRVSQPGRGAWLRRVARVTRCVTVALTFAGLCTPNPGHADEYARQAAAVVAEGWKHRVWGIYPPEKVMPDEALPADRKAEGVSVSAAGGEGESWMVVVRSDVPLREVTVAAEDLRGPEGATLPASVIACRRVGYVTVDTPSGTNIPYPLIFETGTGQYPDPLPGDLGIVRPGRNLCLWMTVQVPRECKPGVYDGMLTLRFRREGWMPEMAPTRFPLRGRVRRFVLPEVSPLSNTTHLEMSAVPQSWRTPEKLRALYRYFAACRQVPDPILPSPKVRAGADGTAVVDAAEWEEAARFCLEELRLPHLFLPVWGIHPEPSIIQGVYFLWHFPNIARQRWLGPFIGDESGAFTPEFRGFFTSYLKQMGAIIERRGWQGRIYLSTMDEPYTYHTADRKRDIPANNYRIVREFAALAKEAAPWLRTFVTADAVPDLEGSIDHWCLRTFKGLDRARARAEKHGETVTFCENYRTFVDFPMVAPRTLGWLAWKLGARGWLTYEVLGGLRTAWEGPVTVYPQFGAQIVWGLGSMFYPDPLGEGLVPSLRWEMMREGCEDYEYLWLLRERARKAPGTPAARAAEEFLRTAAEEVIGSEGDSGAPAARSPIQGNAAVHRLRERAADLIEAL